jgi:hypothetical protein
VRALGVLDGQIGVQEEKKRMRDEPGFKISRRTFKTYRYIPIKIGAIARIRWRKVEGTKEKGGGRVEKPGRIGHCS